MEPWPTPLIVNFISPHVTESGIQEIFDVGLRNPDGWNPDSALVWNPESKKFWIRNPLVNWPFNRLLKKWRTTTKWSGTTRRLSKSDRRDPLIERRLRRPRSDLGGVIWGRKFSQIKHYDWLTESLDITSSAVSTLIFIRISFMRTLSLGFSKMLRTF